MLTIQLNNLSHTFPKSLVGGERVLKQNRGSTGEGIWRVQLVDELVEDA